MIVSLLLVPFIAASVTQDRTASPYVTASPIVSPIVVRYVAGLTFRGSPRRLLAYVALANPNGARRASGGSPAPRDERSRVDGWRRGSSRDPGSVRAAASGEQPAVR